MSTKLRTVTRDPKPSTSDQNRVPGCKTCQEALERRNGSKWYCNRCGVFYMRNFHGKLLKVAEPIETRNGRHVYRIEDANHVLPEGI